jgi:hypothetical protein
VKALGGSVQLVVVRDTRRYVLFEEAAEPR